MESKKRPILESGAFVIHLSDQLSASSLTGKKSKRQIFLILTRKTRPL